MIMENFYVQVKDTETDEVVKETKMKLKAGKYYVGDLCYVLGDKWDEVCNKIIVGNDVLEGRFVLEDGTEFVSLNTAYGDGNYYDQYNREYGVDSGGIGCVSMTHVLGDTEGGQVIEFDEDFYCWNANGYLHFGKVVIDTVQEDDEEYYK